MLENHDGRAALSHGAAAGSQTSRHRSPGRTLRGRPAALTGRVAMGLARIAALAVIAVSAVAVAASVAQAQLPDARGYELVSPADKNAGDVVFPLGASTDGQAVAWISQTAYAGEQAAIGNGAYVARRTASGWNTAALLNPAPAVPAGGADAYGNLVLSGDESRIAAITNAALDPNDQDYVTFGSNSRGSRDVYLMGADGTRTWISHGAVLPDTAPVDAALGGVSRDGSTILFETPEPLTADVPAGSTNSQLYEWRDGKVSAVGLDPSGALLGQGTALGDGAAANNLGLGTPAEASAVSSDGSRIFFQNGAGNACTANQANGCALYVREDGTRTVEVSLSQRTGSIGQPAPTGAEFLAAVADGSEALFLSPDQLTDDATAGGGIYRYDVNSGALVFLTPDSADPNGPGVLGLAAFSADASRGYFVASGMLAPGATAGSPNLYAWSNTGVMFIATLDPSSDTGVWSLPLPLNTAAATGDGRHLIFQSTVALTGAATNGHTEIYAYDAGGGALTCLSCRSDGTRAAGDASLHPMNLFLGGLGVPATSPNLVSADGSRVIFDSSDALVPQDTNGQEDVYEYENGQLHLLSSGTSAYPSMLAGASSGQQDVYFLTRDSLVAQDIDNGLYDIYDARVGGGFPVPKQPAQCTGDGCQAAPSTPPVLPAAATVTFSGNGNVVASSQGPSLKVAEISARAQRELAAKGKITLSVKVSQAGTIAASATVVLKRHRTTVARASRRASRAGTVALTLRLSRAARQQLARTHELAITFAVSFSGVPRPATARLTLRLAPMKRAVHASHPPHRGSMRHEISMSKGR